MDYKKENYEDNKVKDLVFFNDVELDTKDIEEKPKISEEIDQEYKIKLSTELTTYLGKYKYTSILINESAAPINDIKIKIEYPNFLDLTRSMPPTITKVESDDVANIDKIKIEFENIKGHNRKEIVLFFTPHINILNKGEIKTFSVFVNLNGYIRVIDSEPLQIKINKLSLQPKIIPSSEIAEFIKNPEIKKAIRSYGIGIKKNLDYNHIFNNLEAILRANNLQYITKDNKKRIMWYFGTDLETNSDLLVVGQIKENKIEWIISCNNMNVIISLLIMLSSEFTDFLLRMSIIDSIDDLYNLECKACGTVLPRFPEQGNAVKCQNCTLEQIIW